MNVKELSEKRRSVRTFDGRELEAGDLSAVLQCAESAENPFGIKITWSIHNSRTENLKCPVITGTDCFIAGKVAAVPHAEEAFGYSFEKVVLFACERGIGTTWIGGTMDREAFERAAGVEQGEIMPAVSPLGYPAAKPSLKESMMRVGVKADSRKNFGELFFRGSFAQPLTEDEAGKLKDAFEAVRLAPSAVNKQPWRLVMDGNRIHFYEHKSKGFTTKAGWDMQKLDLGIAMQHFAAVLEEKGIDYRIILEEPGISHGPDEEYIAGFAL